KFTAEDVVYSFTRLRDPATRAPLAWRLGQVTAMRAPDAATFEIELAEPYADLLMNLAVEMTCDIDTMLKSLFYLTEQPLFQEYSDGPFYVVMDSFENEQERIDKMLALSGGKSLFNRSYHSKLMMTVAKNMADLDQQESDD
ncbi:MAG: hypothetical protein EOO01_23805, partial [Chitinophagaceae bacterium]